MKNSDPISDNEPQANIPAALLALDGSHELLYDLAQMFCEDAPVVLGELNAAVLADDAKAARRAAHSIKGLAATFYAQATVDLAQRLESDAALGHLTSLSEGGVERLADAVMRLISELKSRVVEG
jgi:HPt (histidine-containing phosphotransfer) domain-containing protein